MKLFNHLHLQIHNVSMTCFSRKERKILVRIVSFTNSRSFKKLSSSYFSNYWMLTTYYIKNTNAPSIYLPCALHCFLYFKELNLHN